MKLRGERLPCLIPNQLSQNSYHVMNIFLIITYTISLGYMLLNFKHDIHMLQQNSYRIDRYWRYLKGGDLESASRLTNVALLFLLFSTLLDNRLSIFIISCVFIVSSAMIFRKKFKKPLVFTPRVKRIYSVTGVLSSAMVLITAILSWEKGGIHNSYSYVTISFGAILLICIFSWIIVMLAVILLKPVENIINRKYWNEADRILKSMPDLTVIGITGSYGKTSTKHYLYRILSEKFQVVMTPGSYNTPMGVIRTIREIMKPYDQIFICEMGAKQKGDIKEICNLVHPSIGIITSIGPMHLESFKTMENVQSTKFELIDSLPEDGFSVVNNDFEYCATRKVENVETARYCVGNERINESKYHAEQIVYSKSGTTFTIVGAENETLSLTTRLVGSCNISNLVGAVIVAKHLGVDDASIKRAVAAIEQVEHRLSIRQTPGNVTIIDDAFNSNPSGAKMALEVLSGFKEGKRIVVTPGMIELGEQQAELNEELGREIAKSSDIAIIVGQYNRDSISNGIRSAGMNEEALYIVESFNEAQKVLSEFISSGDTILYENDLPDSFK